MEFVTRKMESANVGNRLTDWTVPIYGAQKTVERTAFVTVKPDGVNVGKSGPAKIVKRQFVSRIIAIIMEYAT